MQPAKPIKPCDLGLRPVLLPSPGRLKYRNDPVCLRKIYEWVICISNFLLIYNYNRFCREEWKLHPEPGEKKRLSLRWKIREFMLRRDMSSLPIRKIKDRNVKAHHTRRWSPAPYLDWNSLIYYWITVYAINISLLYFLLKKVPRVYAPRDYLRTFWIARFRWLFSHRAIAFSCVAVFLHKQWRISVCMYVCLPLSLYISSLSPLSDIFSLSSLCLSLPHCLTRHSSQSHSL